MREPIVLFRDDFGRMSVRDVVGDLVMHAHRDLHIIMWLDGSTGEMTIGEHTVKPSRDTAICVNSLQPHNHLMRDGEQGLFLAFYLEPNWLQRHRGLAPGEALFDTPTIPLPPGVFETARNFVQSFVDGEDPGHLQAHEVTGFLNDILDAAERHSLHEYPSPTPGDFRIRKAIAAMKANLTARMTFDELARSSGLSRPHFFALFKAHMHVTPSIYWNMLRIEEALRQLHDNDERLTEIALDVGFSTHGNFSRFFREHVGVPPTVYRSAAKVSEIAAS